MNKLDIANKAHEEIFALLEKHKELHGFDLQSLKGESKEHLFAIELQEIYGWNIDTRLIDSTDWVSLGSNIKLGFFSPKNRRTISWEDNNMQPNGEMLLVLTFPAGAYIFGSCGFGDDEDYPTEFFAKFWQELKSYKPKYIDSHNHSMYFGLEQGGKVYNNYKDIFKKYHDLNKEDMKERKIAKMKKEIEKLESK